MFLAFYLCCLLPRTFSLSCYTCDNYCKEGISSSLCNPTKDACITSDLNGTVISEKCGQTKECRTESDNFLSIISDWFHRLTDFNEMFDDNANDVTLHCCSSDNCNSKLLGTSETDFTEISRVVDSVIATESTTLLAQEGDVANIPTEKDSRRIKKEIDMSDYSTPKYRKKNFTMNNETDTLSNTKTEQTLTEIAEATSKIFPKIYNTKIATASSNHEVTQTIYDVTTENMHTTVLPASGCSQCWNAETLTLELIVVFVFNLHIL